MFDSYWNQPQHVRYKNLMDQSDRVPEASRHLSGGLEGVNFLHHPPEHPGGLRTKKETCYREIKQLGIRRNMNKFENLWSINIKTYLQNQITS